MDTQLIQLGAVAQANEASHTDEHSTLLTTTTNDDPYETIAQYKKYISELESVLNEMDKILEANNIPKPIRSELIEKMRLKKVSTRRARETLYSLLKTTESVVIQSYIKKFEEIGRHDEYIISFRDFGVWTMAAPGHIETVGSQLLSPLRETIFSTTKRFDILKGLTGCILPGRLTLLVGPPGSGKSTFLKALSGRPVGGTIAKFDGQIFYNDEDIHQTDKFLVPKVAEYIEQNDTHAPTLTVEETLSFAWECTTGGHHSYCFAKDEETAKLMDAEDKSKYGVNYYIYITTYYYYYYMACLQQYHHLHM